MISKDDIKKEIDTVTEDRLDELHQLIEKLTSQPGASNEDSLISKLRQVEIDGPSDFSTNIDIYIAREIGGK